MGIFSRTRDTSAAASVTPVAIPEGAVGVMAGNVDEFIKATTQSYETLKGACNDLSKMQSDLARAGLISRSDAYVYALENHNGARIIEVRRPDSRNYDYIRVTSDYKNSRLELHGDQVHFLSFAEMTDPGKTQKRLVEILQAEGHLSALVDFAQAPHGPAAEAE